MDHTAVMTGLMSRQFLFGFQEHDSAIRFRRQKRLGGSQSNDSAADDRNFVLFVVHFNEACCGLARRLRF
jgi:hypothetical protein